MFDYNEAEKQMILGNKVKHLYYTDEEYIFIRDDHIFSEEGYDFGTVDGEFWNVDQRTSIDYGWSLYIDKEEK